MTTHPRHDCDRAAGGGPVRAPRSAFRAGFTLAEVMFAMLIMGIGLIAIASLLPIAGSIQQETVDTVMGLNVGRSAEATMLGKGVPSAFATANMTSATVAAFPNAWHTANPFLFPLPDRTYPTSTTTVANRKYYWVPLYRKDPVKGYQFFIFVMRSVGEDQLASVPVVDALVAKTGTANAGDLVVDETTGVVRQVVPLTPATANEWRGVASGSVSRTLQVVTLGPGVIQ